MMSSVARIAGVGVQKRVPSPRSLHPKHNSALHDSVIHSPNIFSSTASFNGSSKLNVSDSRVWEKNVLLSASDQLSSHTGKKKSTALSSLPPAVEYSSSKDESTDIALSQLKELDIAIEVRKVTRIDGRKTRWIEHRRNKQALKQAAIVAKLQKQIKRGRKNRKRKIDINFDAVGKDGNELINNNLDKTEVLQNNDSLITNGTLLDTNFNNIQNNNNIDLLNMKVELEQLPAVNPTGTNVVLETMKQQFLQGTVAVGNFEKSRVCQEKQNKRISRATNGNVSSPSIVDSPTDSSKRKPGRPKRLENLKTHPPSSPKSDLLPTLPFTSTPTNVKVEHPNIENKSDVNFLNQVSPDFYSRKNYLTKGLREVRKSDSGSDSGSSSPLKDNSVKLTIPSSPPLPVSPVPSLCNSMSPKCPSNENYSQVFTNSVKNSDCSPSLETRRKRITKSLAKKENIDLSAQSNNIDSHSQNGSVVSSHGNTVFPPRKKKRGRKAKYKLKEELALRSKKTTVIVDVHNTMSGEPQTVIPVQNPILYHRKKLSPKNYKLLNSKTNHPLKSDQPRNVNSKSHSLQPDSSNENDVPVYFNNHLIDSPALSSRENETVVTKFPKSKENCLNNKDKELNAEKVVDSPSDREVNEVVSLNSKCKLNTIDIGNNSMSLSGSNGADFSVPDKNICVTTGNECSNARGKSATLSESNGKRQTSIKDFVKKLLCNRDEEVILNNNNNNHYPNTNNVEAEENLSVIPLESKSETCLSSDSRNSSSSHISSTVSNTELEMTSKSPCKDQSEMLLKVADSLQNSTGSSQTTLNHLDCDSPENCKPISKENMSIVDNNGSPKNVSQPSIISYSNEVPKTFTHRDINNKKSLKPTLSKKLNIINKQKEKVPRILKQLFQDEGIQNMLRSVNEEVSPVVDGSVNSDLTHKLRPKRTSEYSSDSPEPEELQVLPPSTKRKRRGTEADSLFLDEGTLNLLTSIESSSRRPSLSDDNSIANDTNLEINKSNIQNSESAKVCKKRLCDSVSVPPVSLKAPQHNIVSKKSHIERNNNNEEEEEQEPSLSSVSSTTVEGRNIDDVEEQKLKTIRPSFSAPLKHKSKAQIVLQLRKSLRSLGLPYEDKTIAEMKELLSRSQEEESQPVKSVPPLKIKVPTNYMNNSNNVEVCDKLNIQSKTEDSCDNKNTTSTPVSRVSENSNTSVLNQSRTIASEIRGSSVNTVTPANSYHAGFEIKKPSVTYPGPKKLMAPPSTAAATSITSLIRPVPDGSAVKVRVKGFGDPIRQSQRSSVRQSDSTANFRDICVRKFNNFLQIILAPSTTKMKNALNSRVLRELCEVLNSVRRDDSVRLVLVTSTGSTFCQGIDLTALQHPNLETRKRNAENLIRGVREFMRVLSQFPKVIVAGVNGNAMGLGVTMLPLFDVVFASDKAEFFLPYSKLGQVPEGGATYTFPNYFGKLKSNSLFLGQKLTASQALQIGLVSECIWPATFQQVIIPKVAQMATLSPQSMEGTKALVSHHILTKLELSVESECRMLAQHWISPTFANLCKRFLEASDDIPMQKPASINQ